MLLFSITTGRIPIIKASVDIFYTSESKRDFKLLRLLPRNWNLICGKSADLHVREICLDNQILFHPKKAADFHTSRSDP